MSCHVMSSYTGVALEIIYVILYNPRKSTCDTSQGHYGISKWFDNTMMGKYAPRTLRIMIGVNGVRK
jgi:hypothetical protein